MGFLGKVGSFFSKAGKTVGNVATTVYHDAKSGVSSVFNKGVGLAEKGLTTYGDIGKQLIKTGGETVKDVAGDVKDLGKSFSVPITIAAVAIGAYLLTQK